MFGDSLPLPRQYPKIKTPTLYVVDPWQNDVAQQVGDHSAEETVKFLGAALEKYGKETGQVIWQASYKQAVTAAQILVRPFLSIVWVPKEGEASLLESDLWKDPEVIARSKKVTCVLVNAKEDPKQVAWFGVKEGVQLFFMNPWDRTLVKLEQMPDKAALLAAFDQSIQQFDEWYANWKASRSRK